MINSLSPSEIITHPCGWPIASPAHKSNPNRVQVYFASLALSQQQRIQYFQLLSEEEIGRANRFRFDKDRNQFIAARGILRTLLGEYLHESPEKIRIEYEANGKPFLSQACQRKGLNFNLSHTQGAALFSFGFGSRIGVDIEKWGRLQYMDMMANTFFTNQENEILQNVQEAEREKLFLRFWTRKEAIIKAHGGGLSIPLDSVDVSFVEAKGFAKVNKDPQVEGKGWFVTDLFPCPGFSAALAIEDDEVDIDCIQFPA